MKDTDNNIVHIDDSNTEDFQFPTWLTLDLLHHLIAFKDEWNCNVEQIERLGLDWHHYHKTLRRAEYWIEKYKEHYKV